MVTKCKGYSFRQTYFFLQHQTIYLTLMQLWRLATTIVNMWSNLKGETWCWICRQKTSNTNESHYLSYCIMPIPNHISQVCKFFRCWLQSYNNPVVSLKFVIMLLLHGDVISFAINMPPIIWTICIEFHCKMLNWMNDEIISTTLLRKIFKSFLYFAVE